MFNRENAIGVVLLLLCGAVAVALVYSMATGMRFRLDGPAWLGPVLAILFTGAAIWGFFTRPGRHWPWNKD